MVSSEYATVAAEQTALENLTASSSAIRDADFATVALRFSLVDKTLDRNNGQTIAGSDQPTEATEVWTFVRHRGGSWELSAIQQTS